MRKVDKAITLIDEDLMLNYVEGLYRFFESLKLQASGFTPATRHQPARGEDPDFTKLQLAQALGIYSSPTALQRLALEREFGAEGAVEYLEWDQGAVVQAVNAVFGLAKQINVIVDGSTANCQVSVPELVLGLTNGVLL
jgi:hypothetical protein